MSDCIGGTMARKRPLAPNASDGDGNRIYNQLLLRLPRNEREMVFPKLELVRLKVGQVLHEAGDMLRSVSFCNAGMILILTGWERGFRGNALDRGARPQRHPSGRASGGDRSAPQCRPRNAAL